MCHGMRGVRGVLCRHVRDVPYGSFSPIAVSPTCDAPYSLILPFKATLLKALSPRECKEPMPQAPHGRRDGRASELNDPSAAKRRFRYYRNAISVRLGDACEADSSNSRPSKPIKYYVNLQSKRKF